MASVTITDSTSLDQYKSEALKAAKDFGYPDDVICAIKQEKKSCGRISSIMTSARKKYLR